MQAVETHDTQQRGCVCEFLRVRAWVQLPPPPTSKELESLLYLLL